jgi:hypothetical protein
MGCTSMDGICCAPSMDVLQECESTLKSASRAVILRALSASPTVPFLGAWTDQRCDRAWEGLEEFFPVRLFDLILF